MAALKYKNFVARVKDASDSTLIPVDKILVMNYQVNAGVTNNTDNIKTAITNAGKAFVSGDSLDGAPRNFLRDFPLTAPSTGLTAVIALDWTRCLAMSRQTKLSASYMQSPVGTSAASCASISTLFATPSRRPHSPR
jgi:hypothetical protein